MKLCKATIYYFDLDNGNPTPSLIETLEHKDWVSYHLEDIKEVEIGEWYDEIDLNMSPTKETYEYYFSEDFNTPYSFEEALKFMEAGAVMRSDVNGSDYIYSKEYDDIAGDDLSYKVIKGTFRKVRNR